MYRVQCRRALRIIKTKILKPHGDSISAGYYDIFPFVVLVEFEPDLDIHGPALDVASEPWPMSVHPAHTSKRQNHSLSHSERKGN